MYVGLGIVICYAFWSCFNYYVDFLLSYSYLIGYVMCECVSVTVFSFDWNLDSRWCSTNHLFKQYWFLLFVFFSSCCVQVFWHDSFYYTVKTILYHAFFFSSSHWQIYINSFDGIFCGNSNYNLSLLHAIYIIILFQFFSRFFLPLIPIIKLNK